MKNLIFFATLLIFILNISDNVICAEVQDDVADPVLDLDGNEIIAGLGYNYYIVPTFRPGAGVTVYPTKVNKTCALAVAQLEQSGDGLSVVFVGTYLGEVVRESTNLAIAFTDGILLNLAAWKVDTSDEDAKQYFVTAGYADDDDPSTKWFQILKASSSGDYRFVFCPKLVCRFCTKICTDVGIYVNDEGVRRLAVDANFPSTFRFRKLEQ